LLNIFLTCPELIHMGDLLIHRALTKAAYRHHEIVRYHDEHIILTMG